MISSLTFQLNASVETYQKQLPKRVANSCHVLKVNIHDSMSHGRNTHKWNTWEVHNILRFEY